MTRTIQPAAAVQSQRMPALLLAAGLVCAAAPASASNLFTNGSFETPYTGYQLVAGGNSTAIPGWTTVLNGVEHFDATAWGGTPNGRMIIDLASYTYNAGGLEQTVATVPGQTYDVSFWAGNSTFGGRTGTGDILVTVGSAAPLSFQTPVAHSAALVWEQRSFSFVASSAATTVRFWNNQNANVYFANIDGVSVSAAVPEPQTWALMLAGLLATARVARRRR
jgi:hypothetical protein